MSGTLWGFYFDFRIRFFVLFFFACLITRKTSDNMGLATGATVDLALSSPGVGHRKNPNIKTVYNKILLSAIAFHFCSIHKHNT